MAKIVYISELDFTGSGYSHIAINLCKGLVEQGHEVKVCALSYKNEEHNWNFSILPAKSVPELTGMFHNLYHVWKPDVLIVALDIPWQEMMLHHLQQYNTPYIAITPLESDPLCMSWAMTLMQAKKVFFLSEFATKEAEKVGVPAEHLRIGVDTKAWRMAKLDEKKKLRQSLLGIEDDETFIILTIADNQERKNLSAAMQIVSGFGKTVTENYRYIVITRSGNTIGWRLRDLANDERVSIGDKYVEFDRGLSFKELWGLYACADVFLLTSKGEGFGFPVTEAMSVGVPVVVTEVGALIEHVTEGGGWLIEPAFVTIDPYGNANRYYVNIDDGVNALAAVHSGLDVKETIQSARKYVESRNWDIPVLQLSAAIERLVEKNEQTKTEE